MQTPAGLSPVAMQGTRVPKKNSSLPLAQKNLDSELKSFTSKCVGGVLPVSWPRELDLGPGSHSEDPRCLLEEGKLKSYAAGTRRYTQGPDGTHSTHRHAHTERNTHNLLAALGHMQRERLGGGRGSSPSLESLPVGKRRER